MQQASEKLSITLPAEMVRLIREKVGNGTYASNSEVIRIAMRGWLEKENSLAALDAAIAKGVVDAEAGRVKDIEIVREEMKKKFS